MRPGGVSPVQPTTPTIGQVADEIIERAWLHHDPDSFRAGVREVTAALHRLEEAPVAEPKPDRASCPECWIPFDDDADSIDDALCPWCGARRPEPLQELVWAEFRAVEAAWPEAVGA